MCFYLVTIPVFPIVGILIFQSILASNLILDKDHCSKPFLGLVGTLELILIALTTASATESGTIIQILDVLIMVCRFLLPPLLVWMALELNGMKPFKMRASMFVALLSIPIAAATLALLTNDLHHLYWTSTRMDGIHLIVERGIISRLSALYSQAMILAGGGLFVVGILRHYGRERRRLILLFICLIIIFTGDTLWRLNIPLPLNQEPFSIFFLFGSVVLGLSVLHLGFPRVKSPVPKDFLISEKAITGIRSIQALSAPDVLANALKDVPALSDRQREIAALVVVGIPYRTIAERLGLTERTVKYHMGQILDKCGLETRGQLIAWVATKCARVV
jgi:DNA-binding CsgD family transcriptional regulator